MNEAVPDGQRARGTEKVRGLDAIRGIAVIVAWLYHTHLGPFGIGYTFVDIFGVLSGYLIAGLLLREIATTGRINMRMFYLRRARRLLPALTLAVCGVVLYAFVAEPNLLGDLRGEVVAVLLYMQNWYILLTGRGYFHEYSTMPLRHMWTLSLEEQFYIILPAAFVLFIVKFKAKIHRIPYYVSALALLSAAASAWVYFDTGDVAVSDMYRGTIPLLGREVDRLMAVYMSTFTRAGGFLVGVALAFWWKPDQLVNTSRRFDKVVDLIGVSSMALILALTNANLVIGDTFTFGLGGGVVGLWILCAGAIIGFTRKESRLTHRIFVNRWLVWLGIRAYGLYLLAWPVAQFYRKVPFKTLDLWYFVVSSTIVIVVADLSYRYFENPVRRHGFKAWFTTSFPPRYRKVVGAGFCALFLGVAAVLITAKPTVNLIEQNVQAGNTGEPVVESTYTVVVLGDSTVLSLTDALARRGMDTDAERSRGSAEMFAIAKTLVDAGQTDVVVVHAGNFGDFTKDELDDYMVGLKKARMIVLVTVARYNWNDLDKTNDLIRGAAAEHPNTVLFDWYDLTLRDDELIEYDGVHMTEKGKETYAQELAKLVADKYRP